MRLIFFFILYFFLFFSCQNPNKYSKKGLEYLAEKRDLSALVYFDKALEIESDNTLALYGKGLLLIQNPITEDIGYRMLEETFVSLCGEKRVKVAILLSKYYYSKKNFDIALKYITDLKEKKENKKEIYIIESSIYSVKKQYQKAINSLSKGYEKFSDIIFVENMVAEHIKYKKYNKAQKILLELLDKKNQKQDKYLYNLFNVSYALKDKKNALKYLNLLRKKNSKYIPSYKWEQIISDIRKNLYVPEFDII